ncbi:geranylgeranylglycerol-phosphate geranylgeranyltransferase [Chitinophagaceae bacterium 26-R-25]|nr:geranylgeranylglycerol-phosphate geranylgeranyltransferase [Chitinophagaceae bacterium 26-R-25]
MKLIGAFFRLIRWPNLVFIVITQVLFYYCIVLPIFKSPADVDLNKISTFLFWLIVASSVTIAAAGYIINDYFDLNIDQVNKPDAIVIQKLIKRRWAIVWHLLLSAIGVIIAFYVGFKIGNILLGFANLACVLLLLTYSTTFKKKLLIGNVIISVLTAWVVLVLYFGEVRVMYWNWSPEFKILYQTKITRLFKFATIYAGFAFIISLIREVVKDMEDMEGDEKYGCKTMPIVWGIPASKVFVAVWLIVLTFSTGIVQVYGLMKGWWLGAVYCFIFIVLPLLYLFKHLYRAVNAKDYHKVSTYIKLTMLTGILSILFFKLYM